MTINPQQKPTLFIGIPVFNGESALHEAIDSLLAQTHTDFTLLISDNCSTDNTSAICQKYAEKDNRIQYIRQTENIGAQNNFQFLLNEAKRNDSDYFMWAAHDDLWMPTFLAECYKTLNENDDIGFVITRYKVESRFSRILSRTTMPTLSFVTDPNPKNRVLSYAKMHFGTHKDNLVYAMWRSDVISKATEDLQEKIGKLILGAQINEYILSFHKGGFVDQELFAKKYRYSTPGHILNPYIHSILNIVRDFKSKATADQKNEKAVAQAQTYIHLLRQVLLCTDLEQSTIEQVCAYYEDHLQPKSK